MRSKLYALLVLTTLVACATGTQISKPSVPATEAKPVTETLHGVTVTDPYRWLDDHQAPATRDWIERQNAYTDAMIGHLPQKQAAAARIEEMLTVDQMSTPVIRGGRYFFSKRPKGADKYAIYIRESAAGPDVLLIDPLPMDPKHTTSVGIEDVTDDGKLLAYYVRHGGADETETRFFDVDGRHDTGALVPTARYQGLAVSPDHRTVYYSRHETEGDRVYRRPVAGGAEEKLFGDGYGPEKIIGAGLSDDGHYLLMHVYHGAAPKKVDGYVKGVTNDGPIRTVVNDIEAKSAVDVAGDTLVIQTDWNAPNERVMVAPIANPGREN